MGGGAGPGQSQQIALQLEDPGGSVETCHRGPRPGPGQDPACSVEALLKTAAENRGPKPQAESTPEQEETTDLLALLTPPLSTCLETSLFSS